MRKKVLLAFVFAGGILNSQIPAISKENAYSAEPAIERMVNDTQTAPEVRAFYLLKIASSYLAGDSKSSVDKQFGDPKNTSARIFRHGRGADNILVYWANQVSLEGHSADHDINVNSKTTKDGKSIADKESRGLANTAALEALRLLDKSPGKFEKLNMYFIASCLFQELGSADGLQKCNKVLDETFRACEGKSLIDEEQVQAASSILNSMAFGYVPVDIADLDPKLNNSQLQTQKPFTEEDFRRSEKLKLRAAAMTDRLATTADVRRKAHRDLALWYMQLGKVEMAEKQKQVLFELVGTKDASILYPQRGACGHLVWWRTEQTSIPVRCGMG